MTRAWITLHAAALTAVLGTVMVWVGTDVSFSFDEPASILQARRLADGTGWITPNPLPAIDPDRSHFFYALSDSGPAGSATYAKHPAYPMLLSVAGRMGGQTGMVLLSVVGTVIAALAAARLTRRARPGLELWAFWATGVASPLFFNSQLVIAHTIAAAATGFVALGVVRLRERQRWIEAAGVALLVAMTCALRTEGVLFAIVLGGWAILRGMRERELRWAAFGGLWLAAGGVTLLADRVLSSRIVGGPISGVNTLAGRSAAEFLRARTDSVIRMLMTPGENLATVPFLALLVVLVASIVLAFALRGDANPALCVGSGVALVAAAVVSHTTVPGGTVPSLLVACPVVTVGILTLTRSVLRVEPMGWLAGMSGAFAVAVALTQYQQAGGIEWGARYLASALPLFVPVAVTAIDAAVARLSPGVGRVVVGSLVAVSLLLSGLAVRSLDYFHAATRRFAHSLETAAAIAPGPDLGDGDRRPIVISTWFAAGRLTAVPGPPVRGLNALSGPDLADIAGRLDAQDVNTFVLVSDTLEEDLNTLAPNYRLVSRTDDWRIAVVGANKFASSVRVFVPGPVD